ncbi:AI-2E family transporter [Rhizobacter sp. AJA081-3]|jgi:predicted PurR-regulated permease PerM|uniref:AI-2E family transporter n=1 Tax=Rhizobacter sp. AJA081-3 TaxID=2753607 RepID=UPI001ADF3E88|nr:AI-2E family transporter [Rhizobacter sp. AJA081-3]QTN23236.1 AI-2E family transporter [Rhizobacter sp. AJA081-3]
MDDDPTAATEAARDDDAPGRVHVILPVDVRSVSLAVIALLACVYTLHWASAVFIPLLLGVMLSYGLSPAVERLQRWHLPRAAGAAVLLLGLVAGLGSISYSLADDAGALADSLPDAAQKLREAVQSRRGAPESSIDKMQRAAAKLEEAAAEGVAKAPPAAKGVTRVQIERPRFNIRDYLWSSTLGLVGLIGQAMVVLFVSFFLMTAGDSFRRKMVKLAGPTFSKKKITIQMLDEITGQIHHYLMIQVFTSVLVGVATWLSMWWIGLQHAAVWGIVAAVLNLVPYLGSVATAGGLALVGFLQFGTLEMALLIGGVSLFINTLEGNLLTPWLTGRASRMNPVVIFVGVLAWGWLWGIWGLLLGPPLLMALKSVCDRVDDLKPIGELLGE